MKPGDSIVVVAGSKIRRVREKEMLDLQIQQGVQAFMDVKATVVALVEKPNGVIYDFEYQGESMRGWSYKYEVR